MTLDAEVSEAASRILEALGGESRTAWELKMRLRIPHTTLHLALGRLLERGSVSILPEGLTCRVSPVRPPQG